MPTRWHGAGICCAAPGRWCARGDFWCRRGPGLGVELNEEVVNRHLAPGSAPL